MSLIKGRDATLLGAVALIVFIGVVMLSSASSVFAFEHFGDSYYFVKRQILFGVIPGVAGAFLISWLPKERLKLLVTPLFILSVLLLAAVLIPGVGEHLGRAQRWIRIGGFLLQPSEVVKLTSILFCAQWLSRRDERTRDTWKTGALPYLGIVGGIALLVILEPDLGTSLVITCTLVGMMFIAGLPWRHLGAIVGMALVVLTILIIIEPYRLTRLTTFLNPEHDVQGVSYHVNQAIVAISSGGWFGRGLGKSIQKFQYLPEVASDSLFAIMAEELGFVVVSIVVGLLYWIIIRCMRVAQRSGDPFARLAIAGIGLWLGIQTTINIGANVGLVPFTGVPLPFLSHGGTSMVVLLSAIAIIAVLSSGSLSGPGEQIHPFGSSYVSYRSRNRSRV